MRIPSKLLLLVALVIGSLLMIGCGSSETAPEENNTAAPASEAETAAMESEESSEAGSLVIYSGRSESLVDPIIQQFSEETGIEVEVRYGSTAEMAATIFEEGANSPADVFYGQDPGGLGALANEGLFAPLPAELLELVPERFRGPDGNWVGISGRARVVVYNTENVDPTELPETIEGFTDPKWDGRIGWAPTNGSFQAMVTAMRSSWGEERTRAWLEGIMANNPVAYGGNTPVVEAVGAGEVDVGFVNHYYLFRFLAEQGEEFTARNYFLPGGGPGSLIMVSGAGILASSDNQANAQRFIEYMLSVEGQQYFTSETYEYPVVDGVEISELLTPLAELDAVAIEIDPAAMADLEGTAALLGELGLLE